MNWACWYMNRKEIIGKYKISIKKDREESHNNWLVLFSFSLSHSGIFLKLGEIRPSSQFDCSFRLLTLFLCSYPHTPSAYGHFFFLFRATPTAYGSSQMRGWISAAAAAADLRHSHTGSKSHLWTTLHFSNTRSLTRWVWSGIKPTSLWTLCLVLNMLSHRELLNFFFFF